jgi:hypothetical protein
MAFPLSSRPIYAPTDLFRTFTDILALNPSPPIIDAICLAIDAVLRQSAQTTKYDCVVLPEQINTEYAERVCTPALVKALCHFVALGPDYAPPSLFEVLRIVMFDQGMLDSLDVRSRFCDVLLHSLQPRTYTSWLRAVFRLITTLFKDSSMIQQTPTLPTTLLAVFEANADRSFRRSLALYLVSFAPSSFTQDQFHPVVKFLVSLVANQLSEEDDICYSLASLASHPAYHSSILSANAHLEVLLFLRNTPESSLMIPHRGFQVQHALLFLTRLLQTGDEKTCNEVRITVPRFSLIRYFVHLDPSPTTQPIIDAAQLLIKELGIPVTMKQYRSSDRIASNTETIDSLFDDEPIEIADESNSFIF